MDQDKKQRTSSALKAKFCEKGESRQRSEFRTWQDTNFRKLYKETEHYKNDQDVHSRHKKLMASVQGLNFEPKPGCNNPELNAVYNYTTDGMFRKMNNGIMMDDPDVLKDIILHCRAFNKYIVEHPAPKDVTLYHGSKVNKDQIKKGVKKFRIPKYMSLTEGEDVALGFAKEATSPILEFVVKKGCLNCTPVMHASKYPDEKEWVLPPYTPVAYVRECMRIFATGEERWVITYEVLDGMLEPRDLPTCLCVAGVQGGAPECALMPSDASNEILATLPLKPGDSKEFVESLLLPCKAFFVAEPSANNLDMLLDFLEDVYYGLKSKEHEYTHDEATKVVEKLSELGGLPPPGMWT